MSDVNAADLGDMEVAYSEYANRIWGGRHFASCREFDRAIAKVKSGERQSLLEELTADAEHEARIGEQGNDSERVNAAEKIIEMLNDIRIEGEA